MLKLIGTILVLGAVAGLIETWRIRCKMRLRQLEHICIFFRKVRHAIENECATVPVILKHILPEEEEIALSKMIEKMILFLEEKRYPTGEKSWREAYLQTDNWWYISKTQKELYLRAGQALFGWDIGENVEKLTDFECQMREEYQLEKEEYKRKNKLWTPVGMLLGILLVIVFI